MFQRALKKKLIKRLIEKNHKIVLLFGPRQVGKTTLVGDIIEKLPYHTLTVDGGQISVRDIYSSRDLAVLKSATAGYDLLFIDESQKIPFIGESIKLLHDHVKNLRIILTASSSFDLANRVNEPLTGRKWSYILYPMAFSELASTFTNTSELARSAPESLIWGSYPDVFKYESEKDKIEFLRELTNDYLYKDILELTNIKNANKISSLLSLLAFQVGSTVSFSEFADSLEMSKNTVEEYIDLLEKSFVVFRLRGFSRNLRKEVTKNSKIFFYDLGVRNAIIGNFNPINKRNDTGQLWENFLMIERKKRNEYAGHICNTYFWRTYTGAELDYIEEEGGKLLGYEFTYGRKVKKAPRTWLETYENSSFQMVNKDSFLDFIL